jgi:hypothetical protein
MGAGAMGIAAASARSLGGASLGPPQWWMDFRGI